MYIDKKSQKQIIKKNMMMSRKEIEIKSETEKYLTQFMKSTIDIALKQQKIK